ncbi:MAG TPA: hypothetical protein VFF65_10095 [Phycisphaerales bacterium]|nr:hypothetical protein [Phycisphaerales bacterium]
MWLTATDQAGLLVVTGLQLAMGVVDAVLIAAFNRGSWATAPVPWIHGPPLDVPVLRHSVSYFLLFTLLATCITLAWGALLSRAEWPRWPQGVLAVLGAALLPVHGTLLVSLL